MDEQIAFKLISKWMKEAAKQTNNEFGRAARETYMKAADDLAQAMITDERDS